MKKGIDRSRNINESSGSPVQFTHIYLVMLVVSSSSKVGKIYNLCNFIVSRFLPGAGAVELELARNLAKYADTLPGLEQYAVRRFAIALEAFPKAIADNSGTNAQKVLASLHTAHQVFYSHHLNNCTLFFLLQALFMRKRDMEVSAPLALLGYYSLASFLL